jgi:Regulator of ribonuclease activity B
MTDAPSFPDDENGDVLRRMAQNGDDLAQPRNVEFQHVFEQKPDALEFLAAASDELAIMTIPSNVSVEVPQNNGPSQAITPSTAAAAEEALAVQPVNGSR